MKKSLWKKIAMTVMAVAIIVGSLSISPIKAEAATKGSKFINKKVSSVTPKVKSFKRTGTNSAKVVVTVPKSKVKKLGNSRRITVAYGSAKGNKFENIRTRVNATRKNNTYTFTLKALKPGYYKGVYKGKWSPLNLCKNTYITVRFDGKSNWSSLKQLNNNKSKFKLFKDTDSLPAMHYTCNGCGKKWCTIDYSKDLREGIAIIEGDGGLIDQHMDSLTFKEICEHDAKNGLGYSFYSSPEKVTIYEWIAK